MQLRCSVILVENKWYREALSTDADGEDGVKELG